jgi:hypothetical protein
MTQIAINKEDSLQGFVARAQLLQGADAVGKWIVAHRGAQPPYTQPQINIDDFTMYNDVAVPFDLGTLVEMVYDDIGTYLVEVNFDNAEVTGWGNQELVEENAAALAEAGIKARLFQGWVYLDFGSYLMGWGQ